MEQKTKIILISVAVLAIATASLGTYSYLSSRHEVHKAVKLNNSSNKKSSGDSSSDKTNDPDFDKSTDKYAKSDYAKQLAQNSKYEINKKLDWNVDDIIKTPKNSDYNYDENAKRFIANRAGVYKDSDYTSTVKKISTVKAKEEFRNATDEEYEAITNRLNEGLTKYAQYLQESAQAGGSSGEMSDLGKEVFTSYFSESESQISQLRYLILVGIKLKVDQSTLRVKATDNPNSKAFEVVLTNEDGSEQMAYITGYYDQVVNYFNIYDSTLLKDGAVAYDKNLIENADRPGQQH